jgi:hypothetical protein
VHISGKHSGVWAIFQDVILLACQLKGFVAIKIYGS